MTYRIPVIGAIVAAILMIGFATAVDVSGYIDADTEAYAARAEAAELALADTEATLDEALGDVAVASSRAETVSRSLGVARGESAKLRKQNQACHYILQINDEMLYGMLAMQRSVGSLMRHDRLAAADAMDRATRKVNTVQAVVKRSGYKTLSGLVVACAPPTDQ